MYLYTAVYWIPIAEEGLSLRPKKNKSNPFIAFNKTGNDRNKLFLQIVEFFSIAEIAFLLIIIHIKKLWPVPAKLQSDLFLLHY